MLSPSSSPAKRTRVLRKLADVCCMLASEVVERSWRLAANKAVKRNQMLAKRSVGRRLALLQKESLLQT